MSRKKQIARPLKFIDLDDKCVKEYEVGRLTQVNVDKKFFHMDELLDGKWRITYNGNMFETLKEIKSIEIVRKD